MAVAGSQCIGRYRKTPRTFYTSIFDPCLCKMGLPLDGNPVVLALGEYAEKKFLTITETHL